MTAEEPDTLYAAVRAVAAARPDAPAVETTAGDAVSYAELVGLVDRLAGGLAARGVRADDSVAFALRNSVGYVALIIAVARLGARYVPLMGNFDAADLRTALDRTRPVLVVTDGHRDLPAGPPTTGLDELGAADPLAEPIAGVHHRIFRTLWTSGSTGFPKLMAWRQDKFVRERRRWIADVDIRATDVFLCRHTLDVAHATDLHVFAALLSGARLVLADPTAPADVLLRQLVAHRVTVMSALPKHYEDLVAAADGDLDLSRLRRPLCGGAYLPPAVIRRADEVLGIRIRQIYGSTEFGLALGNMTDEVQADAGMIPVHGVGTRLEPFAEAVGTEPDTGELVLRSDCTSEGYLDNDEANARTFRTPEFWTGDVARRGPDGSYRILGRVSEALATPAGPVLAPMLDDEIAGTGAVDIAVCLAVHPGRYAAQVAVAVRPAPGRSADEVGKIVADILDAHRLDGTVRFVDEIPRTPVGKIDKPLLRHRLGLTGGSR
ncbi:class I adenylate-forming enzyme family protein [Polymorphospora rubra]|uniref:AMP-dependent synthetase/ligase domain-containing protein n=1 Tax=Polymorphospora rubra TaxID=338584 RepID=A0A810MZA2_9ACTN|nr:AMP-binding protein [Polymorphospora rubra]BCJ64695.1 hypothetical protein Prubr_17160 [Polymorphospora rubra]